MIIHQISLLEYWRSTFFQFLYLQIYYYVFVSNSKQLKNCKIGSKLMALLSGGLWMGGFLPRCEYSLCCLYDQNEVDHNLY